MKEWEAIGTMHFRITMLSIHSSPMGRMGTRDTGGMSVYVRELAREMGVRGHQVDIFTRRTPADMSRVISPWLNVRVVFIEVAGTGALSKGALYDHSNAFAEAIDAFRRETGLVYDLIHSNYWLSGVVGGRLKALWRCPHVITFHTLGSAKTAALAGHTEHTLRVIEETRMMRHCDGVIAPTAAEGRRMAFLCDDRPENIHVIPCGVDLNRFKPATRRGYDSERRSGPGSPLLLFVGRFDPMKGIETMLTSLTHLPSEPAVALALIGGDGTASPEHRRIVTLARALGIADRVRFLGAVPHRTMPRHYREADAVVVASRYESFGLVILESMASGTPVASTPVGIAPELIQPGVNGFLAPAGDPLRLAEAISRTLLLARRQDPMKIRHTVIKFGWPHLASMLLDAYRKSVIANSGQPNGSLS